MINLIDVARVYGELVLSSFYASQVVNREKRKIPEIPESELRILPVKEISKYRPIESNDFHTLDVRI